MPTPDEELDAMLAGSAPAGDPDAELEAMLGASAPARKPTRAQQPDAVGRASARGLDAPASEPTWYERLMDAGLQQEKSAAAARAARAPGPAVPESRYADVLQHGGAEDAARLYGGAGLNFLGQAVSAGMPAASIAQMTAAGGVGAGLSGAGASLAEGDPLEDVAKNAVSEGLDGAGMSAVLGAGVKGAEAVAAPLKKRANEVFTHVFMTPAQRTALKAAKGSNALSELGGRARDAGLADPRDLLDHLSPPNAARVRDNAERLMAESGAGIGQFEDDVAKRGLDVNVDYRPITDKMRADAKFVAARAGTSAPKHAAEIKAEADAMQPMETTRRWLPREMPAEQMPLDLPEGSIGNRAPVSAAPATPEQMSFPDMQRQGGQMELTGMERAQTSLPFGSNMSVPSNPAAQGELADLTAGSRAVGAPGAVQPRLANDAAWDAAVQPPAAPAAPAPTQLAMPAQQMSLERPQAPEGVAQWSPGQLEGEQTALGISQQPERFEELTRPRPGRPFADAIADKRQFADEIKWDKSAQAATMGQAAAKKAAWSGLSDQITSALDNAAARGEITPEALAAYRENMQNFSTAATVFDPAMKMAERQGQSGLSATDLLAGAAMQDGGLSVLASKASKGRYAGAKSGALDRASNTATNAAEAGRLAVRAQPAIQAAARENPGGTKSDIERDANKRTKAAMKDWWQVLTGK